MNAFFNYIVCDIIILCHVLYIAVFLPLCCALCFVWFCVECLWQVLPGCICPYDPNWEEEGTSDRCQIQIFVRTHAASSFFFLFSSSSCQIKSFLPNVSFWKYIFHNCNIWLLLTTSVVTVRILLWDWWISKSNVPNFPLSSHCPLYIRSCRGQNFHWRMISARLIIELILCQIENITWDIWVK